MRWAALASMLIITLIGGCDGGGNPPAKPTPQKPAEPPVLDPNSQQWSIGEALGKLDERESAVSAAVRLIRLAGVEPTVVPDQLPREVAQALRVVSLSDEHWAVGLWQVGERSHLWGPVIIDIAGKVTLIGEEWGNWEPTLLRLSPDTDLYPHLIIATDRVLIATQPDEPALLIDEGGEVVRFTLQADEDYPAVEVVLREDPSVTVAEFRWDYYELSFMGPARERIPEEHGGGEIALDLQQSQKLVPIGGIIEQPEIPEAPPTDGTPPQNEAPPPDVDIDTVPA